MSEIYSLWRNAVSQALALSFDAMMMADYERDLDERIDWLYPEWSEPLTK